MRSLEGVGRLFLLLLLAVAPAVPAARAQTLWSQDFDISEGDVNDTFTPLNNQRFASVDDSSNLYICFFDNRNKTVSDPNNFEIYFRRWTYNFGSPGITRVTNAPNPSKYPSMTTLNWGDADTATTADSGRIYLVWQDARLFPIPVLGEPKSYTIFFRTYQSQGGAGFGPEFQVSPFDTVDAAVAPSIAVTPDHKAWMAWQKSVNLTNPDLYYAVYDAVARTVSATTQLTTSGTATSVAMAATRTGEVHVVWVDSRTGRSEIWWKRYTPGVGWSVDTQIVFSPGSASAASICADYEGHLHLVWVDNRSGNNDIFYKEYFPGSGWDPTDLQLTVNTASQIQPYVDADPMDNVYVVWTDLRNGSSNPDIFYKDRKAGTWASDFELVSNATDGNSNAIQRFPGLTHDRFATTYVTWEDERLPSSQGHNKEVFYKTGSFNVTAAPGSPRVPATRLLSSYPNPFNPQATVRFSLARDGVASLRAYDVRGRLVRTIFEGFVAAGAREVSWDGRDDSGLGLPSGTYFLRLSAGADSQSKIVTLLK